MKFFNVNINYEFTVDARFESGKKSVDTDSEGERKYGRNLDQRKGGKKGDKDDEDEEVEEYWFVCKRYVIS